MSEVETLRMGVCGDACLHIAIERDQLKARAERLAEALRVARNRIQRLALECPHGSDIRHDACEWADEASAALRDHDQEAGNG